MNPVVWEQLELNPGTRYVLYIGEIKAHGLNDYYRQALSRHFDEPVDCISVVPDVLQDYPQGNLLVINDHAARLQSEAGKQIHIRLSGSHFAAMVNENPRFRDLLRKLKDTQGQVPLWMFDSRGELEFSDEDNVLLLGPRPDLAETINNKAWQYRHLSRVVPMTRHCICEDENHLRASLPELGLCNGSKIFVTQAFGAAGAGSGVICSLDDLGPCLGGPGEIYVAGCYIPHKWDPTVLAVVANEHDVYVAGVADMTIEGGNKFRGSSFPSRLPFETQEKLVAYTRMVGRTIGRLGYRGIFGCDYIVDDSGDVYFIEVNARKQGTTMEFCCTLEAALPDGAPNLPELEYSAITRNCFPAGTAEPSMARTPLYWGTYNLKAAEMVTTHSRLPQEQAERALFQKVAQGEPGGHLFLEHVGANVQVTPGAFLARAVAVGRNDNEMRRELDMARQAIEATFAPLGN